MPPGFDHALYMLVADGEVQSAEGSRSIAWFERQALALKEDEAFWVRLGCLDGRERYAAIRIGAPGMAQAAAFRPARQAGFLGLFQLARSARDELQCAARALHMGAWLHRSRYCGTCGEMSTYRTDLNKRVCTNAACGHESFPRIEPAVIALVTNGAQCLLARQATFPTGYYAPLAGFVEAGETPEQAVGREVLEEVGQTVQSSTYVSAQPWPFPGSLMLGFIAHVAAGSPILTSGEIEHAIWVDRMQAEDALANPGRGSLLLPPPGVIGRRLIERWLSEPSR
jgi:NADH pyrophosphatase NudC (nudix superfamily)